MLRTATWFGYPGYGCTAARLLNEARGEPSDVVPITSGYSGSGDPVITSWKTTGRDVDDNPANLTVTTRLVVFRPATSDLVAPPVTISDPVTVAPEQTVVHIPVEPGYEFGVRSTGACAYTSTFPLDDIMLCSPRRRRLAHGHTRSPASSR